MLTTAQLAARTEHAVAAAAAAGRDLGLTVREPVTLYDVFSVVVHLAPAPVVARVPTVLPRTVAADPAGQQAQQRRELAVAGWLAARGCPVVGPSPLVPPEPVCRDGYSMTFWRFVEQVPDAAPGFDRGAELAADLHAALRHYPGELPFLFPLDDSIPDGFAQLEHRPDLLDPADLSRARQEWAVLAPLVPSPATLRAEFPGASVQPIHGDAPFYNIIVTPEEPLFADFEHVTLGPVEWDLAGVGPDGSAAYDAVAARLGLRPVDERLLRVMAAARAMQLVACLSMAPELPMLVEGLAPALNDWRATPLAGGLG